VWFNGLAERQRLANGELVAGGGQICFTAGTRVAYKSQAFIFLNVETNSLEQRRSRIYVDETDCRR
jgi:hypothetical protein